MATPNSPYMIPSTIDTAVLNTTLADYQKRLTDNIYNSNVVLRLVTKKTIDGGGSIVEPLIAASIVYVAVENIFAKGLNPWRPFVIFGFGLLHGLGFASVLGEFGLPDGQFIPALIAFNIGVELGQLTVIALAFLAVGWFARKSWYRAGIAIPASCIIAAVGAYWCIERVFF